MKILEITNAADQLALLRLIIDNTWSAIKQQADAQAKQKPRKTAPKAKIPRVAKVAVPKAPALQKALKPPTTPITKPVQPISAVSNQNKTTNLQLTPTEREELAKSTAIQMGLAGQKN